MSNVGNQIAIFGLSVLSAACLVGLTVIVINARRNRRASAGGGYELLAATLACLTSTVMRDNAGHTYRVFAPAVNLRVPTDGWPIFQDNPYSRIGRLSLDAKTGDVTISCMTQQRLDTLRTAFREFGYEHANLVFKVGH